MSEIFSRIIEGYLAPTRSARNILEAECRFDTILLMVLFSYLATAVLSAMFGGPRVEGGASMGYHISGLILQFASFFVIGGLIFQVGRLAGGIASRQDTYAVVGWHSMVTSFLTPLLVGLGSSLPSADMPPEQQAEALSNVQGPLLLAAFAVITSMWLLAHYVKEAHGFQSVWNVLGSLMLGGVARGIFFVIVATMFGVG